MLGAGLYTLHAEDALRVVRAAARVVQHVHLHGAGPLAGVAADAFAVIAGDAQEREVAYRLEEDRDGADVLAEGAVVLEGVDQGDAEGDRGIDVGEVEEVEGISLGQSECDGHRLEHGEQGYRRCVLLHGRPPFSKRKPMWQPAASRRR